MEGMEGIEFGVWGLGCGVWGLGVRGGPEDAAVRERFKVSETLKLGRPHKDENIHRPYRVWGLGFRGQGVGFGVEGLGRVEG